MEHGVAYQANQAIGAVYADLAALFDQATNQFNSRYVFQEDRRIVAAAAYGVNISAARITTPTLRLLSFPEIFPLNTTLAPVGLSEIQQPGSNGPMVLRNDEMAVQTSNADAGIQSNIALIWTDPAPRPAPVGATTTVKCTGALAAVINAWTAGPLAFVQQLPAGRYACTGFSCAGAGLIAARLIFPNQPTRPMVQALQAVTNVQINEWRFGAHGLLGEFHTYAPPQLEILASAANTAQQVILDLIRLGSD